MNQSLIGPSGVMPLQYLQNLWQSHLLAFGTATVENCSLLCHLQCWKWPYTVCLVVISVPYSEHSAKQVAQLTTAYQHSSNMLMKILFVLSLKELRVKARGCSWITHLHFDHNNVNIVMQLMNTVICIILMLWLNVTNTATLSYIRVRLPANSHL